jgi:hypothetical protein
VIERDTDQKEGNASISTGCRIRSITPISLDSPNCSIPRNILRSTSKGSSQWIQDLVLVVITTPMKTL